MPSALSFEKAFLVTTTALRLNRAHPYITRNFLWISQYLIVIILSVTCFVFLTNSVIFYDIPAKRFFEASKNGTMTIVTLTITFKYTFLLYFQNNIKGLIEIVNNDYELSEDFVAEEKAIVLAYSKNGARVSTYWLIAATLTSLTFPLKALIEMGYSIWIGEFNYVHMFDLRFPDKIDVLKETVVVFWMLFALCLMFSIYASTMYVGFDPLGPIFLLHICGQLDVLSIRIMQIFTESPNSQEVSEKLKQINKKLQDLYSMIADVKSMFTMLYEYVMKTTTILLPLSLFQVVEDLRQHKINVEFISFFIATILHFYIPSYYSDMLMDRSENLRKAIYSCGWEKYPDRRAHKTILLMLTRTSAPLVLSTVFCPICLDTFAEMCRQAYAIFNIMNAAWA